MQKPLFLLALPAVLLVTPGLEAQAPTLRRVILEHAAAPVLAEELDRLGFDVVEGSVQAASLELVVSVTSLDWLVREGFAPRVLEVGRPMYEILAEASSPAAGVPAGYLDGTQILAEMTTAASTYPSICQLVDLTAHYGTPATFQGRHLYAVKISDNVAQDEDEPASLVHAGAHCRELGTHVVGLDTIARLTSQYGIDAEITALVDSQEIWVLPNANPDGYDHVFNVDNLWRKNRRVFANGTGVDLNRNYTFGWSSSCAGSTSVSSDTYKGPSPESEAEVQTVRALHLDRRFAKVLDYHSYGSYTLNGYLCWNHPWGSFLAQQGAQLSSASGYGGSTNSPSAHGEHYQSPLAFQGSLAFLTEIGSMFQPSYATSVAEANQVFPGTKWLLQRPLSLSGHVVDACSGAPLTASIDYPGVAFTHGEQNGSGGPNGRYHAFLPSGTTNVRFSAPGYASQTLPVIASASSAQVSEIALVPSSAAASYCSAKLSSVGCLPLMRWSGAPSASALSGFLVEAADARNNKAGLLFYGIQGQANLPFQGGTLCVAQPIKRTPVVHSGGSASGDDCTGVYSIDFNAFARNQLGGTPIPELSIVGTTVCAQWWGRDPGYPAPNDTTLSNGVTFTLCP